MCCTVCCPVSSLCLLFKSAIKFFSTSFLPLTLPDDYNICVLKPGNNGNKTTQVGVGVELKAILCKGVEDRCV